MTGFPVTRQGGAPSVQGGPSQIKVQSSWYLIPSRRWLLPIALALTASLLLTFYPLTTAQDSGMAGSLKFSTSTSAEASPLQDDEQQEEQAEGEGEPEEATIHQDTEGEGEKASLEEPASGRVAQPNTSSRGGARPTPTLAQSAVAAAMEQLGARYRWGGASPAGFDCSGFTMYVYRQAGIDLPRSHWGQIEVGRKVEFEELQPGDLVFFENTYAWGLSHSGVYIGNNEFIHAETEWTGVVISPLAGSNWGRNFAGATRPYEE